MKKILFSFLLLCWFASTGQNFPENPDPNKCYIKVTTPDRYEYKNIEIVKEPEHKILSVVPPKYETIVKKVLVKPSYKKLVVVPEVWGTELASFVNQDMASVMRVTPPVFDTKTDTVVVSPAYSRWEVGGRKPNCFDPDPDACKFWRYKEYPAKIETHEVKYVAKESRIVTSVGNKSTTSYEKYVLLEPARVEEVVVPAEYENIEKKILVSDSYVEEKFVPAVKETITRKVLVEKGGKVSWKGVDCSLLQYQPLPIIWEYNSAELTGIAKTTIDATLMPILIYNPGVKLEIASHTDSRGNGSVNKTLSEQRAKAVAKYLVSKGIQEELLVPVGYGETRLINDCTDEVSCSEAQHEKNRRTEFRLLE
ncbi:OmpA family protein [Ochrovirga pacifica]|uniref:OmpA family protein n=1 Tax=Ochrovirga pacifica TaxID=1042376 RepID=UPI0002557B71|nr:OmpA family protein [Ochrovirga pacifica]